MVAAQGQISGTNPQVVHPVVGYVTPGVIHGVGVGERGGITIQ